MVTQIIGTSAFEQTGFPKKNTSTASSLAPNQRKQLALNVLQRTQPVSHLAQDNDVSRKFLYQQAAKASEGLDQTFAPSRHQKDWIKRLHPRPKMRRSYTIYRSPKNGFTRSFYR